jgi:5-methylcytosine-specific restriction endonuclease McrA
MLSSTTLVQKVAARRAQSALWCRACGGEGKLIAGLCSRCYSRRHWDKHYFAGLRAQVLDRDGHACQLCTRPARGKRSIIVHHRRPGISKAAFLIALCPACHARLHRTRVLKHGLMRTTLQAMVPFEVLLWREIHPDAPEQLALAFDGSGFQAASVAAQPQALELALA